VSPNDAPSRGVRASPTAGWWRWRVSRRRSRRAFAPRRDVMAERNLGRANQRRGEMKSHTPAAKFVRVPTGLWAEGGGRVANMAL